MNNKILCFECILYQLINWYKELRPTDTSLLSFTRLKVLKLLFFVSAIQKNEKNRDLLDIFNNFYAMQHGPVESDIYKAMIDDKLPHYSFKFRSIYVVNDIHPQDFQELGEIHNRITTSINLLRETNENIVTYTASQLVDLSHKWESWQLAIHMANTFEKGSEPMDCKLIRSNCQYYSL